MTLPTLLLVTSGALAAIVVDRGAGHQQAEQAAQRRQGHGQHDGGRVDEALELGRQHQEHQQQGEAEGDADGAGRLQIIARLAVQV